MRHGGLAGSFTVDWEIQTGYRTVSGEECPDIMDASCEVTFTALGLVRIETLSFRRPAELMLIGDILYQSIAYNFELLPSSNP